MFVVSGEGIHSNSTPDDSQDDNRSRLLNSINTGEDEDMGEEF